MAIYGQEVSTIRKGNHIDVFDVGAVVDDTVVKNGDVPALLAWVKAHPPASLASPLLQFNHPRDPDRNFTGYGRDDFAAVDWVKPLDPASSRPTWQLMRRTGSGRHEPQIQSQAS